jgi:hypothetical protein
MIKTMWLVIVLWTPENGKHNYYLKDPVKNYHIAATLDEKLPYEPGSWIKATVTMECDDVQTIQEINTGSRIVNFLRNDHFCNTTEVRNEECNERNSFVIGGIRYC